MEQALSKVLWEVWSRSCSLEVFTVSVGGCPLRVPPVMPERGGWEQLAVFRKLHGIENLEKRDTLPSMCLI